MNDTHLEASISRKIVETILNHITSNPNLEDEYAKLIEDESHGDISADDFRDWVAEFDVTKIS